MRFVTQAATLVASLATGCSDFNLGNCSVPESEVFDGGPGRDGIPALNTPPVVTAEDTTGFMPDNERVLGVEIEGAARAYPLRLMWWHEIVNDTLGATPIAVTYCPLTGSGLVFSAQVDGTPRLFGVSGLLFENNLVMFDRQTESLWSQLRMEAICGPERGASLTRLPVVETTWGHWRTAYPLTTAATPVPGLERPYSRYPYGDYSTPRNPVTLFPSSPWSRERPPKEPVLGVREGAAAAAFPFGTLGDKGAALALNEEVGGRPVLVAWSKRHSTAKAFDRRVGGRLLTFSVVDSTELLLSDAQTGSTWTAAGEAVDGPLSGTRLTPLRDAWVVFWFSWSIFYRDTRLFR